MNGRALGPDGDGVGAGGQGQRPATLPKVKSGRVSLPSM